MISVTSTLKMVELDAQNISKSIENLHKEGFNDLMLRMSN